MIWRFLLAVAVVQSVASGIEPFTAPGRFVYDAERPVAANGMRLVSRPSPWYGRMPGSLKVWATEDAAGTCGKRLLAETGVLPPCYAGESQFLTWSATTSRYWLVEAREKRALFLRQAVFALKLGGTEVFMGRAEDFMAREGACDVLVTDGFSGNVLLKGIEGTALYMSDGLKKVFLKNALSKLGALLVKGGLREFKKSMDYTEVGGAPLLGVGGVVVKAHGSSNAHAIACAIRQAALMVRKNLVDSIEKEISKQLQP